MVHWRSVWWCLPFALFVACGDDDEQKGVTLQGSTACERWASLAEAMGCAPPDECSIPPQCENVARAWVDCAATDREHCYCESDDGDLNCEGSFKPNEGPARCIAEEKALRACQPD